MGLQRRAYVHVHGPIRVSLGPRPNGGYFRDPSVYQEWPCYIVTFQNIGPNGHDPLLTLGNF